MRRRSYLAAGGSLAAALAGGMEAVERGLGERVYGALENGGIEVRILETNAPVEGGSLLEVTVEVENTGTTAARPEIVYLVEGERRSAIITTVEAGDTETLDHGSFRTYPVGRDDEVTVRVETDDDADERTVDVLAVEELDPAQTSPEREIAVQPGTSVFFEVESDVFGEYGGRTQWFVDGEYAGHSMGPWYSAYYSHRGAEYWQTAFDSSGTHEVAVAVGDDETYRATWTVDVTESGVASPTIEATRPADEELEVVRDESTELELDVSHPDGALDRVVWWLSQADVVLETTDVSGAEDTATIELDGYCHTCSIVTWVIDEYGTVTSESPWVIDEIGETDAGLAVTIIETNDPVDSGEVLEVTAELENATGSDATRDVELIVGHDPELVDSRSVSVDSGETETVELEFTTADVRRTQTFPARVETEESADERTVEVIGTEDVPNRRRH